MCQDDEKIQELESIFKKSFLEVSPDFQTKYGYPLDAKGEANMTVATNAIAHRFKCMAYTLEMPFKDNADMPCEKFGWSAKRSSILGHDMLTPIYRTLLSL